MKEKAIVVNDFIISALNNNFMKQGRIINLGVREYTNPTGSLYFYWAKIDLLDFSFYHFCPIDCNAKQSLEFIAEHFNKKI